MQLGAASQDASKNRGILAQARFHDAQPDGFAGERSRETKRRLAAERIAKAPKLKLALTAGIGSDHVDLQAAMERGITVAEVTFCNSISVAEHVAMMILGLVRNYIPAHQWVLKGGWNIADCVARSYDVEGMHVGTAAAGRIGLAVHTA